MKYLITTIVALVLVGCGPPPKDIWEAAHKGNIKAVKKFIANGADVNEKLAERWQGVTRFRGMTPLCFAATGGHREVAKLLITEGADANTQNRDKLTPLWRATYLGHDEVVRLLIRSGADVNVKMSFGGETPLHEAAYSGRTEIAEDLIKAGADVNAKDGCAKHR